MANEIENYTGRVISSFNDPDVYSAFLLGKNLPKETPFKEKRLDFYNHLLNTIIGEDDEHQDIKQSVHEKIKQQHFDLDITITSTNGVNHLYAENDNTALHRTRLDQSSDNNDPVS